MGPRGRRWRRAGAAGGAAIATLALVASVPRWLVRSLARVADGIVWRVETSAPLVGLSFDDGPDPVYTPQVLERLARAGAHATFFLIGERAARHPDLVARIHSEGHEVAHHHLRDGTTLFDSAAVFEEELLRTEEILGLRSARTKLFRPPGGLIRPALRHIAERHGYRVVLGSSYGFDPYRPPTAYIRWVMAKNLERGAIAILHDAGGDRSRSVAALDGLLEDARGQGLRFVTVSELMAAAESP